MAKEAKILKELDNKLKELVKVVEQLQTELKETKLNLNSRIQSLEVALKTKDDKRADTTGYKTSNKSEINKKTKEKVTNKQIVCKECNEVLENVKALKNHKQIKHQKSYKCNHCNYKARTVSGIDEHIQSRHETENVLHCDTCDKTFKSELRLKIHKNIHQSKKPIRFCHYHNNDKYCPFEQLGCKFKHEYSEFCLFKDKCNRKLCQFRHKSKKGSEHDNKDSNVENVSMGQKISYNYSEANDIFCDKYCADENEIHIHDTKTFKMYRGIDIQNHENVCRCMVCDFTSAFIDEHMEHYDEDHEDIDISISCTFDRCAFKADLPENLIKHIMREHHK